MKIVISIENKTTVNVSLLSEVVMDFVKEWTEADAVDNQHFFVNGCLNIANQTDGGGGIASSLLMPFWAYQLAAAYLILISVIGLPMNILVVIVILNDPMRMTALNSMLLNLACSDGIIAAFGAPVSAAAAFHYDWPFSSDLCVAYAMIMSTAGIGSITTLTALALWRCQLVVYCPAKRSSTFANNNNGGRLGHCQAVVLLTIIWTYSLAVTCPPLFGWGRYDMEASHISCSVNWESKMDNNRLYIVYMFAFGFFVPLTTIIVSYVSILRVVKKTREMRRKTQAAVTDYKHESQQVTTAGATSCNRFMNTQHRQQLHKRKQKVGINNAAEKRVTVMVACMVGAFMTAWTPYSILALYETFIGETGTPSNGNNVSSHENLFHYVGTISPGFATIPSLFAKSSAILNPLIYGLLNTQFRSAWEKFLTRFLGRRHGHLDSVEVNSGCKRRRNWCRLFECRRGSSTLKPSTTVRLSMKQIRFNESQSAYVIANPRHLVTNHPVTRVIQQAEHWPYPPRTSSSTADDETTIIQPQSMQMRSFTNAEFYRHKRATPIKLANVPVNG